MKKDKGGLTRRDLFKAAAGLGVAAVLGSRVRRAQAVEIPTNPSILVVGWDGADYRTIMNNPDRCPFLHANYLARLDCSGCTRTRPGWAELATGLEYDVTKVFSNDNYMAISAESTIFHKLKTANSDYHVACVWSKIKTAHLTTEPEEGPPPFQPLHDWAQAGGLDYYIDPEDYGLDVAWTISETDVYFDAALSGYHGALIENGAPGLVWCHYSRPDYAGHNAGADSEMYLNQLGKLNDRVAAALGETNEALYYKPPEQRYNFPWPMQPDIWFAVSDHGFDHPDHLEASGVPTGNEHHDAPHGFVASNVPLHADCTRRDFGYTLHEILGLPLVSYRNSGEHAPLRGRSVLA